ncbi:MAG: hypothetical protein HY832_00725, partial [Candidatus Aenigmarchaeota archaeon]|nr:hypothetical protein [Candidatus Aenigmarchaeota archaeon]
NSTFTIFIGGGHSVKVTQNSSLIIAVNISTTAQKLKNVSVNITSNIEIGTATTGDNVSIVGTSLASNVSQIQDVRAYATIGPGLVDTNVINQTLIYTITRTGTDRIDSINVTIPTGYTLKQFLFAVFDGTVYSLINTTTNNHLIVTIPSPLPSEPTVIKLNFTVDTNTSFQNMTGFMSTITGSNMTNVATVSNATEINVTTQTLISNITITGTKTTAVVNGTDYWEFNLTLGMNATFSRGRLQFKMTNWTDASGNQILLRSATNSSLNYTQLRDSSNATYNMTVLNDYDFAAGFLPAGCCTRGGTASVILRMIIPTGTISSSTWFTTYNALFRTTA